jgi:predicted unusual protein kinase regulating ubiquinone biosynthesis (AarF/ABC1/UbiB family)
MNFQREAENSYKIKENFAFERDHYRTALVVPDVVWAKRRILVMECKYFVK